MFRKLAGFYGSAWLDKWVGLDLREVKATWAEGLGECTLEQVRLALDNLKGTFPPSLPEFREACRQYRVRHEAKALQIENRTKPAVDPFIKIYQSIGKPGSRGDA